VSGALGKASIAWSRAEAALALRWEGVGEENRRMSVMLEKERRAAREAVAEAKAAEVSVRHALASANEAAGEALRARDARDAGAVGELVELSRRLAAAEEAGARKDEEMAVCLKELRGALEAAEVSLHRVLIV